MQYSARVCESTFCLGLNLQERYRRLCSLDRSLQVHVGLAVPVPRAFAWNHPRHKVLVCACCCSARGRVFGKRATNGPVQTSENARGSFECTGPGSVAELDGLRGRWHAHDLVKAAAATTDRWCKRYRRFIHHGVEWLCCGGGRAGVRSRREELGGVEPSPYENSKSSCAEVEGNRASAFDSYQQTA
jgi:hypothetical protein